jgi:hypothetical protein
VRPLKFLIGLALLPFCWAATRSVAALVVALRVSDMRDVPLSAWWLLGGFLLWLLLFITMPRPVRTYVLGHELTHAFWALLMGARVSRLRVSARGGSVNVSKSNWIITLAPYFFPFYTVLVIALYSGLALFRDLRDYEPFWLALVGLTWSFHLTFTVTILLQRQPDIQEHGRVFSYAVIYLLNVLGVGLWIVGVASPTLQLFANCLIEESRSLYELTFALLAEAGRRAATLRSL